MNNLLLLLAQESVTVPRLDRIYQANRDRPDLASEAISAMRQLDADLAWRAVWLLKRLARDKQLGEAEVTRLALCADEMPHWAARLNLCQLFSDTGCPLAARDALFPYLVESFSNRRVIIRAWAISTLAGFRDDKKLRPQIDAMLREARADPAASMKARLRHLDRAPPRRHTPSLG